MKVVLFCGGQGMRMRDYSEMIPKPLVPIGYRPILWHVMKYYSLYGHKDFVLCLGYRADLIKKFFLEYEEADSNDFVLEHGGEKKMLATDIHDWRITFVDTGINASIGERLRLVREHLDGEDVFMANYADGVTDLDLDDYVEAFKVSRKVGGVLAVRPPQSYHVVNMNGDGTPHAIGPISQADLWLNAGYFVFRQGVFEYLERNPDLAPDALHEMIEQDDLYVRRFDGFWSPMDTFKDKTNLDEIWESTSVPWLSHNASA